MHDESGYALMTATHSDRAGGSPSASDGRARDSPPWNVGGRVIAAVTGGYHAATANCRVALW